ncbi:MAG: hypothetical protein E7Z79_02320 [Methanobrevibacter thaueri]|uniref:Uncharacterized protein n=1 Tax=Methanobrevibacter thaueri TaxID=190975 RepID=A0A8T3VF72_9EURY|nr:hypothetical protein [Methanobrevibacter thaueri]MBE6501258.1 hypothetical protein [Methanobrevibacter thaueri]
MGFFNNVKNIKDQVLQYDSVPNFEQLQIVFDKIDDQADKENEKKKDERKHFESLSREEKIEYKKIQRRNKNLKRLGLYGLTAAGMATGVGIPVLMAANIGTILSDDNLTYTKNNNKEDKEKKPTDSQTKKPREYFTINYTKEGLPKVSTLVDRDPFNLEQRYNELMRE